MSLAYRPSQIGDTPEAFFSGIGSMAKNLSKTEDNGQSAARRWLDMQQQQQNNQQADDGQSFFNFEPQTESTSPFVPSYPSLPEANLTAGWNAIPSQVPSPPDSVSSPAPSWPPFQYGQQAPVHNILTDIYPDTRVQFGQSTPPDDEFPNLFPVREQSQDPFDSKHESAGETHRKRSTTSSNDKTTAPKRSRKHGRNANASNGQATSSAEEVRRHKFLERNRIAASKCRQKKKEWTQNLETRARELAKENNSLRLMVDSMRDEMLFIKGEMLKHTSCGCDDIQDWLKSGAGSLSASPVVKTEHSPIQSAEPSRRGSITSIGGGSFDQEATSPVAKGSEGSTSQDLQNLEGLLMDQLVHDTSDEGIISALRTSR
ncbi:MAG: hypothetical protein Q9201_003614 [Fulgogasparrea decipioides]